MSNQVFATAQECASEISKLRAQGVACRLQKVEGGFSIVLMNGKVQPRKAKVEPATSKVEPNKTVVKAQRESINTEEIMQDIHAEIRSLLKENEGLHEEDQIKVLDFDIAYRPVKGSSTLWKLFVPIEKAAVMLTYLNTHVCLEADPSFPAAQVDVYEKGPANDLFVSLAVVILIEDGDIPDALHRKMIEKFR